MRTAISLVGLVLAAAAPSAAQDARGSDVEAAPPTLQVAALGYCRGTYRITFKDGPTTTFEEYDLGLKTDTSANGPAPGVPVMDGANSWSSARVIN